MKALPQIAEKGDEHAITAVSARLEDNGWHVRYAAVEALAQIANKGDERAITAVAARLEDDDGGVRSAAAEALGWLQVGGFPARMLRHVSWRTVRFRRFRWLHVGVTRLLQP